MLFRDDDNFTVRDRAIARDAYERMVSTGRYQFQEAVQDSMLGLKKLYQAVLGKYTRIENIPTNENAYIAENLMSSVNAVEQLLGIKILDCASGGGWQSKIIFIA